MDQRYLTALRALMSIVILFATEPFSWAVSEKDLAATYQDRILKYYETGVEGVFTGKDGVPISHRSFTREGEEASLVIVPGLTESALKYAELIYDFRDLNLSIHIIEHRGQGKSGKVDDVPCPHVRDFNDYVEDFSDFLALTVKRENGKKFLLANSMGAAISSLYLLQHPGEFDGAVFSAPMFDFPTASLPKTVPMFLLGALNYWGWGNVQLKTGSKPVTQSELRQQISTEVRTHCPDKEAGVITLGWIHGAISAVEKIRSQCDRLQIPVLLLQAGEDRHVPVAGQDEFCRRVNHCQKAVFPGALHELLFEKDEIRDKVIDSIKQFLTQSMTN